MTASLDLLLALFLVAAELPPAPPAPPESIYPRPRFVAPLDTRELYKRVYDNCIEDGSALVMVTFMADGTITDVTFGRSSRNRDVDRAIVALVRKQRIEASGRAGTGSVPFTLASGRPSTPQDRVRECDTISRPSLNAVIRARSEVTGLPAKARLVIAWEGGFVVHSTLVDSLGNADVDAAIEAWGLEFRMVPGSRGQGYVDVEIPDDSAGDAP
jgi:TonB family protein